jgi:hypothetical protein
MYLASYNATSEETELRSVDLTTGSTTLVGILGSTSPGDTVQTGWLAFESPAPAEAFKVFLPFILKSE